MKYKKVSKPATRAGFETFYFKILSNSGISILAISKILKYYFYLHIQISLQVKFFLLSSFSFSHYLHKFLEIFQFHFSFTLYSLCRKGNHSFPKRLRLTKAFSKKAKKPKTVYPQKKEEILILIKKKRLKKRRTQNFNRKRGAYEKEF